MLKQLRHKKTAKKIWITLIIVIVFSFLFWGVEGLRTDKETAGYAGVIFGRKISNAEYKEALAAVRNQAVLQFEDRYSEMEKNLNLDYQAWMRIMLLSEAKKRRIAAADKEVIGSIETSPLFQRNGQFDNATYSRSLRYLFNAQPRSFEEQVRQNLILAKLYKQVTEEVKLEDEQVKKEYQKANQELSISYILSSPAEFKKNINPAEEQLKDYFAKNSLAFKQPLSFNVAIATLDSENKVNEFMQRISKKEDFNKIAKDLSLNVKETGFFSQNDPLPGIGWSPEVSNIISKLKEGQVSDPIKMDKFYFIKLNERKEAFVPELDKIKEKVKEAFIKDSSEKAAQDKIESCLKKLNGLKAQDSKSIDFAAIAKEFGLESDSTANFKYGSYIEGIGASDIFWITAQELKDNETSNIIRMPTGFFIIRLKAKTAIEDKKFAAEKAEFSEKLLEQKKQEFFSKFADELKRKAQ